MISSLAPATAHSEQATATVERRRLSRRPVERKIIYVRRAGEGAYASKLAWLCDVSSKGVGLIVGWRVEPASVLELEIHDLERHQVLACRVSVRHVTALVDGRWLLGGVMQDTKPTDGHPWA